MESDSESPIAGGQLIEAERNVQVFIADLKAMGANVEDRYSRCPEDDVAKHTGRPDGRFGFRIWTWGFPVFLRMPGLDIRDVRGAELAGDIVMVDPKQPRLYIDEVPHLWHLALRVAAMHTDTT